jgi:hypothetical protein
MEAFPMPMHLRPQHHLWQKRRCQREKREEVKPSARERSKILEREERERETKPDVRGKERR